MKSVWNLLSLASLALILNLGISQKTFAEGSAVTTGTEESKISLGHFTIAPQMPF